MQIDGGMSAMPPMHCLPNLPTITRFELFSSNDATIEIEQMLVSKDKLKKNLSIIAIL